MWEALIAPQNIAFSIALTLMLFLAILEIISLMLGGISDFLDGLLPDSLMGEIHSELAIDSINGPIIKFLSWLYLGKIPVLIWLVCFLSVYSGVGFFIQLLIHGILGIYLPVWIATILVLILCLPLVRWVATGIAKIMPKDETTAVVLSSLIGRTGEIILGNATINSPAQAKVKDQYGQIHYMLVEPDLDETLIQGTKVLLVSQYKTGFKVIKNPYEHLSDTDNTQNG